MLPTISVKEYETRLNSFKNLMAKHGIDLVVGFSNILDPSTVRFFSDFSAVNESSAVIIPLEGNPTLCCGQAGIDYAQIKNKMPNSEIIAFPEIGEVAGFEYDYEGQLDFKTYFMRLKERYNVKRIGTLGELTFPAVIDRRMREVFSAAEVVNFDLEFYKSRVVKSDDEIACIKHASKIITDAYTIAVPQIKVGMTEREIQAMFESEILCECKN